MSGAMDMDINLIRALVTVVAMVSFLAIVLWAYLPHRKGKLDAEARRILEEADLVEKADL
jgi:cbb3-type cytochrome oxidase subunit 3